MDPFSITVSCLTLIGIASVAITTFIRGCRAARSDLTSISGELTQLQLVLELLKDDTDDQTVPETLRTQILSIIANCSAVVDTIDQMLQKHGGKAGPARWTAHGKTEVEGLRMSLQAHRGSLSLSSSRFLCPRQPRRTRRPSEPTSAASNKTPATSRRSWPS